MVARGGGEQINTEISLREVATKALYLDVFVTDEMLQ